MTGEVAVLRTGNPNILNGSQIVAGSLPEAVALSPDGLHNPNLNVLCSRRA